MALQNPWVTYLDRSYKNIKAAILARMQTVVPEITDHSESNLMVIILELFAGLVEQLNYYIDNVARESYISTARKYSSMIKLTRLIDYRVRAKIGSTVDIKIIAVDSSGDPVYLSNDYTFDSGLILKDANGVQFITLKKATIFEGSPTVSIGAIQRVHNVSINIGTTNAAANQAFKLHDDYQHDTLQITIDSNTWELQQTFAFSGPTDRHFIVEVNSLKEAWVIFGDDINGDIPTAAQVIYATFYTCDGSSGNLAANTINLFDPSAPADPGSEPTFNKWDLSNPLPSAGGIDEEDLERIRVHAPISLRTLDRAVTLKDYEQMAILVPGVGKASVDTSRMLNTISIYIAPEEGGFASGALLTNVETYFESRRMLNTFVTAYAAGESILLIDIEATAKFRRDISETETDIENALLDNYGFNKSAVNNPVRRSDIIALVDNLDKVDYLKLNSLSVIPYARILVGSNALTWLVEITDLSTEVIEWRLAIINATTARLWKVVDGAYDGDPPIDVSEPGNTTYTSDDGVLKIGVYGAYSIGDEWRFKTYPHNADLEFSDFTVPVAKQSGLTITVNPSQT